MSEIIKLADHRPPVVYTISLEHHWDGQVVAYAIDVSDDARSKEVVWNTLVQLVTDYQGSGDQAAELAALRQSTQSNAQRNTPIWTEAATIQTNGRWEGKTARSDALREAVIEECAKALEADAMKCDCAALEERECGCGAWCEWKSITSARAVEIVRSLQKLS